jgi:dolichol-phosphate mannosyltransferase
LPRQKRHDKKDKTRKSRLPTTKKLSPTKIRHTNKETSIPDPTNSKPATPHPTVSKKPAKGEKNVNSTNGRRVAIILPTYCEAENIADIIQAIEDLNINSILLVIDDSSPDETENIVCNLQEKYDNIMLLKRAQKMGLGTAITDGFRFLLALPKPPKYIITMDADYSHNPQDIPRLLKLADKGCDLVIGSRYCQQGKVKGWKLSRILISKIANRLTRTLIKLQLNDYTSGFRCYSRGYIIKALPKLHSETYEIQIETLRQAKLQNSKIGEIPIIFENRKKGKSKLSLTEITAFSRYILKSSLEQSLRRKK